MRRTTLLSTLAAAFLLAGTAPAVGAMEDWCDYDPPVTVMVNGRPVTVNVTLSLPRGNAAAVHTAAVSGSADGSTVTVVVRGPASPFRVTAEIHRLRLSAGDPTRTYAAGETVTLTFANVSG